jgi:hypothetical protein
VENDVVLLGGTERDAEPPDDIRDPLTEPTCEKCAIDPASPDGNAVLACWRPPEHEGFHWDDVDRVRWTEA